MFLAFSTMCKSVISPDDRSKDVFILSSISLPSPHCGSLSFLQIIDWKMCSNLCQFLYLSHCRILSIPQMIVWKMCSYLVLFPYLLRVVEVCQFSRQLIGRCVHIWRLHRKFPSVVRLASWPFLSLAPCLSP